MHSESIEDQNWSVALFEKSNLDTNWPKHHRDIIKKFGRFPHRNGILNRQSTKEEINWLKSKQGFNP